MSDPKQKSLDIPRYLIRMPTIWQSPQWMAAAAWRQFVYNQPIAMLCRARLISHLQGMPWEIKARDEQDGLEEDINYYTKWVFKNFDTWIDTLWQDALDLPIGGNTEAVRWPAEVTPRIEDGEEIYTVTRPHPYGHIFKLVHVDGANLYPTFEPDFPMAQRIPESLDTVFFTEEQLPRIVIQPRTEMRLKGYGKAPPEQVYLAIMMVHHADHYYSDLLKNAPPVGILDLMDLSQQDAEDWAQTAINLFEGTETFKIPLLYDHKEAAKWIPFGRAPEELMFDRSSIHYARIVAAAYGLTLGNLGLEPKGDTLAGSIRDDTQAATGYGVVVEKTKGLIDGRILPPYLEWVAKSVDFEQLTGRGRAFLVTAQALKAAKDAGALKPSEVQAQLIKDGFITVEVEKPDDKPILPMTPFGKQPFGNEQTDQVKDKVPPEQGGRGDVTEKAMVNTNGAGDER